MTPEAQAARVQDAIDRLLADAPPLTDGQKERLRVLLLPDYDDAGPCTGPAIATTSPRPVSTRSGS